MFQEDYLKAIESASIVHVKSINQINTKQKTRAFAIYLLQGSNLTQFYLAYKGWANGDLNAVFRSKRFIDESIDLANLFSVIPENDRRIQRWFSDQIIDIPNYDDKKNEKLKLAMLKRMGIDAVTFKKMRIVKNDLYHEFSKGMHPNFYSVVFNADKNTHIFDYQCGLLAFHPIAGFDFGAFVVIPVLQSIISYPDIIPIVESDWKSIRSWIDKIQKG